MKEFNYLNGAETSLRFDLLSLSQFRGYEESVDFCFGLPSICVLTINFYAEMDSSEALLIVGLCAFSTGYYFMLLYAFCIMPLE